MMKGLFVFLFILHQSNAQFGEIASVIGSLVSGPAAGLVGSGALGGLSGLAGSAGGAAASGASGALGGIGGLYQLAQAALSLTGTGVGILNQASESSWFPAAIDGVAKANRDFQERILAGTSGTGGGGGAGTGAGLISPILPATGGGENIGTEYGKNFGNGIDGTDGTDGTDETDEKEISYTESTDEFGEWTPEPTTFKTFKTTTPSNRFENKESTTEYNPDYYETRAVFKVPSPETDGDIELIRPIVSIPKKKDEPIVPISSFLIDEKPIISNTEEKVVTEKPFISTTEENIKTSEMSPQLHKLIQELKHSRLTKAEFTELANQLEDNKNFGEPRENSTPAPEIKTTTADPDDDTSPITDTEMIEAEKRLNESIARLNESLKPRLFDAPILVVKKPTTIMVHYNTPSPIIHTNFLQPVRAAVNVPRIETNIPFKPLIHHRAFAVTSYPPIHQIEPNKSRTFVYSRNYVTTKRPVVRRRYIPTTHPTTNRINTNSGSVTRKVYHTTFSRVQSPPPISQAPIQGRIISNGVRTYQAPRRRPNLNQLPNLIPHQKRVVQQIRPSPQGNRIISHGVKSHPAPRANLNQPPNLVPHQNPVVQQISPSPQGYRIANRQQPFNNQPWASTHAPLAHTPFYYYTTRRWN